MAKKYRKQPVEGSKGAFVVKGTRKANETVKRMSTIAENLRSPLPKWKEEADTCHSRQLSTESKEPSGDSEQKVSSPTIDCYSELEAGAL